jgi:dipeptidyl aminopeptidase/acylaminoacyl peptidase
MVPEGVRGTAAQAGSASSVLITILDLETKKTGFASIDLVTGRTKVLQLRPETIDVDGVTALAAANDLVIYAREDVNSPMELWVRTRRGKAERITSFNPAFDALAFGRTRLLSWTDHRGLKLRGTLLLPVGYVEGRQYPLVTYVYPNDARSDGLYRYGVTGSGVEDMQLLARRGYAVLAPDMVLTHPKDLADTAAAILPGVDQVIALGIADPGRLALMGHSNGGNAVLATLTQTNRFAAAVARGAPANATSFYGVMTPDGSSRAHGILERRYEGTLWQKRDRYIANSPVFYLDRIQTPVLLIHGANDSNVPVQQAEEVFMGLKRLGKRAEYARYRGEDHVEATWSRENGRDYLLRVFSWFGRYLGPAGR